MAHSAISRVEAQDAVKPSYNTYSSLPQKRNYLIKNINSTEVEKSWLLGKLLKP
jgi:hypothetical protein